ncbi:MAG: DUF3333 domain-containing protein, partial [Aestuariivirgaceae bacterium]
MTDIASKGAVKDLTSDAAGALARRHAAEKRFRAYGVFAIAVSLGFLVLMVASIAIQGLPAFQRNLIGLDITFDEAVIDPDGSRDRATLKSANYTKLVRASLVSLFPDVNKRREKRALYRVVSSDAGYELQRLVLADPAMIGQTKRIW